MSGVATNRSVTSLTGEVHGGQAPIYDAAVYLLQTATSGYPSSEVGANSSIITAGAGVFTSSVEGHTYGTYVLTDASGNFTIPGFTCTPGAGVYLLAVGGQPLLNTTNDAATEMAPVGICPTGGAAALITSASDDFVINEVTTVATAWALQGFTTPGRDASHISSSSTNATGLKNAFTMAMNLIGNNVFVTGASTLPGNSSAAISYRMINSLANILSDCVNSSGSVASSTPCYTLFQNATSNGVSGGGVIPTDTASAAINMSHNQSANVPSLYALASNSYSPFSSALTAAPAAWTISIQYAPAGLSAPTGIAADQTGNIWITNATSNSLTVLAPTGIATGTYATGQSGVGAIAIDLNGNAWVAGKSPGSILEVSSAGAISTYSGGLSTINSIAIDGSGNVWVAGYGIVLSGTFLSGTVDGSSPVLSVFSSTGTLLSSTGYSGGGASNAQSIAITPH